MFIRPLADRVLIEPVEVEQKVGSIVVTGGKGVDYLHGIVIAKGPGKQKATGEYVPIPLELGQTVIYGNVSSTLEDMVNGKKVLLVEQNAIVGIITDDHITLPDSDHAHLSQDIKEHIVSEEPLQEVYKDDMQSLVPRTPSTNYIGTEDE
jgi:chaperonin GroES